MTNERPDLPAHFGSLIRAFLICLLKHMVVNALRIRKKKKYACFFFFTNKAKEVRNFAKEGN